MSNWIKLQDYKYNGLIVHEVRCPVCRLKETYIGSKIPRSCYICDTKLKEAV
jgi:hypothetical protein